MAWVVPYIPAIIGGVATVAATAVATNKSPTAPAVQEAPTAPTVDQAAQRAEEDLRLRRRRGRSAYIFSGRTSTTQPTVGVKTLTGQ